MKPRPARWSGRPGSSAHDELAAGCSLDGDVDNFTVSSRSSAAKSPRRTSATFRSGDVPTDHLPQITAHLWITGAEWCDFVQLRRPLPAGVVAA